MIDTYLPNVGFNKNKLIVIKIKINIVWKIIGCKDDVNKKIALLDYYRINCIILLLIYTYNNIIILNCKQKYVLFIYMILLCSFFGH